jgi:hypothetical protein
MDTAGGIFLSVCFDEHTVNSGREKEGSVSDALRRRLTLST